MGGSIGYILCQRDVIHGGVQIDYVWEGKEQRKRTQALPPTQLCEWPNASLGCACYCFYLENGLGNQSVNRPSPLDKQHSHVSVTSSVSQGMSSTALYVQWPQTSVLMLTFAVIWLWQNWPWVSKRNNFRAFHLQFGRHLKYQAILIDYRLSNGEVF